MAKRRNLEADLMDNPNLQNDLTSESPIKQDRRKRPRIVIPLQEDGTPDISKIDPAVLDALRSSAKQEIPEPIDPEVIKMAVSMIANIEAAIVAPRFGIPSEQALPLILPPKPIADQIGIAGSKVLSKYSGVMGKYQDEIILGALLVSWQISVLNNLRAARREMEAKNPPEVLTEKVE